MGSPRLEIAAVQRLFEKMTEGVLILDSQWNILFANGRARTYLNIPLTENRVREDLIPKLSQHFVLSAELMDVAMDEESIAFEASNRPEHSFDMVLSLYMSRPTEDGLRFLIIRDVTEERREELLKRNFLSLISHKLLTPITVIKNYLESMTAKVLGPVTEKQEAALAKSLDRVERLSAIVQRLSTYTQLQSEHPGASLPYLDAMERARALAAAFGARLHPRRVEIAVAPFAGDATVAAREAQFDALIENLLDNAVKFATKDAVRISVEGRSDAEDGSFRLTIRDDGPGMPPAVQARAFESFVQRDDDFTGNVEGLGLGLPMVRQLMALVCGRVEIESAQGAGTAVHLIFPPVK